MTAAVPLPTRDHLVATARQVLDAHGLEGLTLREIARQGGLSHGAPLRHFPSLSRLLAAVAAEGFRELMAAVDASIAEIGPRGGARERLAAGSRGYLRFALHSPGVFALIFRPERVDVTDADYADAGAAAFDQLRRLCAAAQADGLRPDVPTDRLAAVLWASVHGLAQLALQGALGRSPATGDLDEIQATMHELLLDVRPARRRPSPRRRGTSR